MIDIWCEQSYNAVFEQVPSINEGKKLMRQLKKDGRTSIRMYSDNKTGTIRHYYYFKGDRIIKENNNFDN